MPLAFESISHGTIAFGFFNIDSDMLLLEQYLSHTSGKAVTRAGGMTSGRIMWWT
jgi:hypothetical protein